jgi:hypothetical protein
MADLHFRPEGDGTPDPPGSGVPDLVGRDGSLGDYG